MSLEVDIVNVAQVTAALRNAGAAIRREAVAGLYQVAEEEMAEAKRRVPVDTGALASSGYVTEPREAGNDVNIGLGFGGPAAPYALVVHEDLSAFHEVGQAKYLESTLVESAPYIAQRVARRINAMRGG